MLIPLDEARNRLIDQISPVADGGTLRSTGEALGEILARDIIAPLSLPLFDNSAVDGYGVHIADLTPGVSLPLEGRAAAGHVLEALSPGSVARILTGARVPSGVEAVVMQEDCTLEGDAVRIGKIPALGENIRHRGEDIAEGTVALPAGIRLTASHLALLAGLGIGEVAVRRAVRVGFMSTGDEIIPVGQPLPPGHIYDSNRPLLMALGKSLGAAMIDLGHVRDRLEDTIALLASAKSHACDLIVTMGGASVGDADFVKPAIEALGSLDFWRIALKPGKPVAFGRVGEIPVLALPGNPGAVHSGFLFLAAPLIRRLQGRAERLFPLAMSVEADFTHSTGPLRAELVACTLDDTGRAHRLPAQGSGNLSGRARAEGVALIPPATTTHPRDRIDWYSYTDLIA